MHGFAYPPDDPGSIRAGATCWRSAAESLGLGASGLRAQGGAAAAAWEGAAANAAVRAMTRMAARHDIAATALSDAASVLYQYASALDGVRADVDRLNAEAMLAESEFHSDMARAASMAVADPSAGTTQEQAAIAGRRAAMMRLQLDYQLVLSALLATAVRLGARLGEIASLAAPGAVDPDRGPAAVVAQNAGDRGYVDWVTHLALNHPNLTPEQRLWLLGHRQEMLDTLLTLLSMAVFLDTTEYFVANYRATEESRNSSGHLNASFDQDRFEFMNALLIPAVIGILTSRQWTENRRTTTLSEFVVAVATMAPPPAEVASAVLQNSWDAGLLTQPLTEGPSFPVLPDRLEHIVERHGPESTARNVSHFAPGTNEEQTIAMIHETIARGRVGPNTNGRDGMIYEFDFGHVIGTDIDGLQSRTLLVVIRHGSVWTAFPV